MRPAQAVASTASRLRSAANDQRVRVVEQAEQQLALQALSAPGVIEQLLARSVDGPTASLTAPRLGAGATAVLSRPIAAATTVRRPAPERSEPIARGVRQLSESVVRSNEAHSVMLLRERRFADRDLGEEAPAPAYPSG